MATLNKEQIERALTRLGELAEAKGLIVELVAVGGAVMVLEFEARDATQDVDVVIAAPPNAKLVREIAATVAADLGLSSDWLNDAAKGYVGVPSHGPLIFNARGITVRRTSLEQMLAMKVSAWRDDVDITDAARLLREIGDNNKDAVWAAVEPFVSKGKELKAWYAFLDLWEDLHG